MRERRQSLVHAAVKYLTCGLLFAPSFALAKCVSQSIPLAGEIKPESNLMPVSDLVLSWKDGMESSQTSTIKLDESGQFETSVSYNTYSGSSILGYDQCDFELSVVQYETYRHGKLTSSGVLTLDKNQSPFTIEADE